MRIVVVGQAGTYSNRAALPRIPFLLFQPVERNLAVFQVRIDWSGLLEVSFHPLFFRTPQFGFHILLTGDLCRFAINDDAN